MTSLVVYQRTWLNPLQDMEKGTEREIRGKVSLAI